MKIEQIAPDKVRVTLSEDDLVDMEIDPTCFLSDTAALNGFIINLMHEIYKKTDFNPYQGNITMEAQPEMEGMTILLSKVDFAPPIFSGKGQIRGMINVPKTSDLKVGKKKRKIKSVKAIKAVEKPVIMHTFIFNDFENVCKALVRMSESIRGASELYRIDGGYSLLIPTNADCLDDIAMVMEFADDVRRSMVFEHIREHGECIAKGEKLTAMSERIKELNT